MKTIGKFKPVIITIRSEAFNILTKTTSTIQYDAAHRVPNWMPLKVHLKTESFLEKIPGTMVRNKFFGPLYHLIYGWVCAYSLREVIDFIKRYGYHYFQSSNRKVRE